MYNFIHTPQIGLTHFKNAPKFANATRFFKFCCNIFKVCMTILGPYALKNQTSTELMMNSDSREKMKYHYLRAYTKFI